MPALFENISLKPYNTFGIGVNARWFARFATVDELRELLAHKVVRESPRLVLGGGSNILFTRDWPGVVLKNEMRGVELVKQDEVHWYVKALAGSNWHRFVQHCISHRYAGIENLSLIPGCVGAGPMQNIGAYGVELKDVFHELEAVNLHDGSLRVFSSSDCRFGYRESVFKREEKDRWAITSVTLRLNKRPVFKTSYGAIEQELEKMQIDQLSIAAISKAVIAIRSAKLPDPRVLGNAGSFFKNPVVSDELYQKIKSSFPEVPAYPVDEGGVKIPAGWLIEKAGWKGHRAGACGVHRQQALVLVNYGGASGSEVFALSEQIMRDVKERFGVQLEREVNIL